MDATLKAQAQGWADEIASKAQSVADINGLLRAVFKSAMEQILDTEMDHHLGRRGPLPPVPAAEPGPRNRRNGRSKKTIIGDLGDVTLDTPRDRNGSFEPQLIGKHQRRLAGFDEKILTLYAKGLTTRDIRDVVEQLYGVEVSPSLVSDITADLDIEVAAWRNRRLDGVYPVVYFDGIVVHVRGENGKVSPHTMYVGIGINLQGKKELLGLWLHETEGAKFWLSCLTDLKARGLNDIFIVCVDGLTGFPDAIRTAYPQAKVQLCIVHLVRAALKYVTTADSKAVVDDLKKVYQAATLSEAEQAFESFAQAWEAKYPTIAKQWRLKWTDIITLFDYPPEIRKAIYTTNAIESVNSVIRKYTRNRKLYPNAESAIKMVYLAIHEAEKKWTLPIKGWKQALNHFAILFEGRLPENARN